MIILILKTPTSPHSSSEILNLYRISLNVWFISCSLQANEKCSDLIALHCIFIDNQLFRTFVYTITPTPSLQIPPSKLRSLPNVYTALMNLVGEEIVVHNITANCDRCSRPIPIRIFSKFFNVALREELEKCCNKNRYNTNLFLAAAVAGEIVDIYV